MNASDENSGKDENPSTMRGGVTEVVHCQWAGRLKTKPSARTTLSENWDCRKLASPSVNALWAA
jgi:hypothetical protein